MPKKPVSKKKKKAGEAANASLLPSFAMTDRERSARRLMWAGVIGFSAIIFALWGWSLTITMSSLHWNKAPEVALASKTKQEWNDIFAKQKERVAERDSSMQKIKDALNKLNTASAETATSTSQTASTTAATTSIQ